MEIEFFCHPSEATEWYAYWRKARFQWYVDHGIKSDKLRLRDHDPDELAFYSTATADIEYSFPFGISELEGIAHRGDYDLGQHQKFSGKDLTYFDEEKKERYLPHVIEPSAGADRATLAFLCEAYQEDQVGGETRTVLKFHPRFAPLKAAVFPWSSATGCPRWPRRSIATSSATSTSSSTRKGPSAAAIAARTKRAHHLASPSMARASPTGP